MLKIDHLTDFEYVKDHIYLSLINTEKNELELRDAVFTNYYDMSMVYSVLLGVKDDSIFSVRINRKLLDRWNKTEMQLIYHAAKNTPDFFPLKIFRLTEKLLTLGNVSDDFKRMLCKAKVAGVDVDAYVVTNNQFHMFGSNALYYKEVLEELALGLAEDIYVIPSSKNELIMVPASIVSDVEMLYNIVVEVNSTVVSDDDFLSNSVFLYSVNEHKLAQYRDNRWFGK